MADVLPRDILLRVGGLNRQGIVAGGRRVEEQKEAFTRATVKRPFRDRDGTGKRASAGNLAIDWPTGLVDASGNALGGPLVHGARTQLVTDPENFGAWAATNVTLTSGQSDPFGGTAAYLLTPSGAISDRIVQAVTFTGDGSKTILGFMRAGSSARSALQVHDATTVTNRHSVHVTWTGGVPTLSTQTGSGTRFTVESWGSGWYALACGADAVVAANSNNYRVLPDNTAGTGTVYFYGANAWNAVFPSVYQFPSEGTGVADALTVPYNWGPSADITVLVRLGRPQHQDTSAALGVSPGIFSFGAGSAARIGAYFDPAARNIISVIDTGTTDATQTTPTPAGNPVICIQYKNLTTGGQTALDVGSGFTAFSSTATAFSAFSSQTLRVGRYDDELYGVVGEMIVARGLRTRAEMLAVP